MNSDLKVGDKVRVIKELIDRYLGTIDTIDKIEMVRVGGGTFSKYYLKNCQPEYGDGRLWFTDDELELVKDFYWLKKF